MRKLALIASWQIYLHRQHKKEHDAMEMDMEGGGALKHTIGYIFIGINAVGLGLFAWPSFI